MAKTLLHVCCGPCASACVPRLKEGGREVTMLFANSNIDTREEFDKRLSEARRLAEAEGVAIAAVPYNHEEWLREVADGYEYEPEKGTRCERCFRYNLGKAAEFAKAHGFDECTTSLTVSPHKVSAMIFAAGAECESADGAPRFLREDFKKKEGFKLSVRRTAELGLYRQAYCGCEFSKLPRWKIHHKTVTESTNLDARGGAHGEVFTADFQTAGRGRLDHKWLSPPGTNLMMSVVLLVDGQPPEAVATLPLVIGLAVARAIEAVGCIATGKRPAGRFESCRPMLKWPNDVLVDGKKIAGILCERHWDNVIAGIGVNVGQTEFPPEIAERATSLARLLSKNVDRSQVMRVVLAEVGKWFEIWRARGFAAVHPEIAKVDWLCGQTLAVLQTDDDAEPIKGVCGGIQPDGALDVGGVRVYAGEAHVEECGIGGSDNKIWRN